ncbi:hypothetical protein HPB50_008790 [Hyalomma asiaticum]|uniref:Uncharacterized protein n=1 Tax=Hyalomma asiaticum TaxID=266040 RepID=A0ACB7TEQ2_HYAAI|nr:hypothetical protein HPB50_008790 [Hyalomma asiaticum]
MQRNRSENARRDCVDDWWKSLRDSAPASDGWAYPRGQSWYETTVPHLPDSEFRAHFRVTRRTFRYIISVCECMQRQDTAMRRAVPLDKRIAVGLYRLASSAEERTIGNAFGLGRSTVNTIFREFCAVIVRQLGPKFVRFPKQSELAEHLRQFSAVTSFPQAVGALDGCHIEVCPPVDHATDYINYKGWYSTILLAVADHNYKFLYTNVGSPGRNHDAGVFESSKLPSVLASPLFRTEGKVLAGVKVEPLLLADQAFPLQTHIMKLYPNAGPPGSPTAVFNYHLSSARRVVENAFGRLKARFRVLLKGLECDITNVNAVIRACCVIHNICEELNDSCDATWLDEVHSREQGFPHPLCTSSRVEASGVSVRNALASYLVSS